MLPKVTVLKWQNWDLSRGSPAQGPHTAGGNNICTAPWAPIVALGCVQRKMVASRKRPST